MASVGVEHVTKRYGEVIAVRDLTLHVRDHEFMVLLGPSGCGKTTTLRLIAGLERVTEGRILIGGNVVNDLPPGKRDLAMVFQSAGGLFPHLNVYRNLAFALEMRRASGPVIERQVGGTSHRLGLDRLLMRRPPQLSFGHQQQVALGRVLVRQPGLYLFDQPLSNLDAQVRAERRLDLRRLHRELGATVICTTHDQAEAMTLGDRIAVMRDGELEQVGSPRGVYDYPANQFVARSIGSPPMNLVPVVVEGSRARASGFSLELPRAIPDQRAVLGIRPEDLTEHEGDGRPVIEVTADLVEMVGPHQLVHGRAGEDRLVARVRRSLVVFRGDRVRLAASPTLAHVFDATSGRALR
jgi:multiple sugar transport system ATP-binding protein